MVAAASPSTAESTSETIVLENIGPIEHLEIPAKPGTIVVLRGPNGSGKSTALSGVSAIATKSGARLTNRDGTNNGFAEAFGVKIKVGRGGANRRSGDLEIESIEDKICIADLVDPKVKDPVSADTKRIRALVSLLGWRPTVEQFAALVGGDSALQAIVSPETLKKTDPIELTEAVKRDIEKAARTATAMAENYWSDCQGKRRENEGIDLDAECDEQTLAKALEAAITHKSKLEERASHATGLRQAGDRAAKRLEDAGAKYSGPTIEDAREQVKTQEAAERLVQEEIDRLEKALAAANKDLIAQRESLRAARFALQAAEQHAALTEEWCREVEAAENVTLVSEQELLHADDAVNEARAAVQQGVRIRDGKARATEADRLEARAAEARKQAEQLRDAAASTLDVLAAGIRSLGAPITVDREFRLVCQHPRRGECYYSDLSEGERWTLALDMVVAVAEQLNVEAVLAIPQTAWEGLDAVNRELIAEHVAKTSLIVITAEASREKGETDLTARVYNAAV